MIPRTEYFDRISLCGFAGSGKSTIAPLLAKRLHYRVIDCDAQIRKQSGLTVSQYFTIHGERAFRALERKVIEEALRQHRVVIALGGGSLMHPATAERVTNLSTLVYLSCSHRELVNRLRDQSDRPLLALNGSSSSSLSQRIRLLLRRRIDGYRKAELVVSTTQRTILQTVATLRTRLKLRGTR